MSATGCNRVVVFAGIIGTTGYDRTDILISRDLIQQLGLHGSIANIAGGDVDARTSSVSSSIPMCILRYIRRFGPPCLRVQRENSPPDCFRIRFTPLTFTLGLDTGAVD